MNRLQKTLQLDKKLLSIYFTAGYPNLNDTVSIIQELEKNGVDFIEIGLPFSDISIQYFSMELRNSVKDAKKLVLML